MSRKRRTKAGRIPLTPRAQEIVNSQLAAFREKFGRVPGPTDPVFFDPDADEPRELDADAMERAMIDAMAASGVAPQIIFAYARTGMLVSESNQEQWSDEDMAQWDAAIDEFFALEDKAERSPN